MHFNDFNHRDGISSNTNLHVHPTDAAILARGRDHAPYWGDEKISHPAVISGTKFIDAMARVVLILFVASAMGIMLSACAMYEHRDGGGYTVRYMNGEFQPPPEKPRPVVRKVIVRKPVAQPAAVVVIAPEGGAHTHGESHPVLNVGKDEEIPREYRHYVSDRSIKGLRSRSQMCKEARPGYCNSPNIAHCHGPFCHAHVGGDRRHTH